MLNKNTKPEFTKDAAKQWMQAHCEEYADFTRCIIASDLAEACANHFGVTIEDDDHWIWDLAMSTGPA